MESASPTWGAGVSEGCMEELRTESSGALLQGRGIAAGGWAERLRSAVMNFGASPGDSDEERLRKRILVIGSLMLIAASTLWGLIYILFGEPVAGFIPLGYALFSVGVSAVFAYTRDLRFYRDTQLWMVLMIPFLLMVMLGGFVNSSAVIIWSLISPLGALLLYRTDKAYRWLYVYLGLLIISAGVQPFVRSTNNLPATLVLVFFLLNIGTVSVIVFLLLAYFVDGKELLLGLLRIEQDKSERLLMQMLPKEVAPLLKEGNQTVAKRFDSLSVMFADIVGFTELSSKMSAEEVVELLNELYSYFDGLTEQFGLEKIRTIGDNYMVAAGAPTPRGDHALVMARMALEIMKYLEDPTAVPRPDLQFRIGIASGPAVGGVVGTDKYHYDLWGQSINIASRMESQGVPGKIQITQETYEQIKGAFSCSYRGLIDIKGIGEMPTWFLDGRLD
jgi:adenylate cyclase